MAGRASMRWQAHLASLVRAVDPVRRGQQRFYHVESCVPISEGAEPLRQRAVLTREQLAELYDATRELAQRTPPRSNDSVVARSRLIPVRVCDTRRGFPPRGLKLVFWGFWAGEFRNCYV
jgi:hypothetical protein